MPDSKRDKEQTVCPTCGGMGQISFFKGESRFLLSDEECPTCCGFGYLLEDVEDFADLPDSSDDEDNS